MNNRAHYAAIVFAASLIPMALATPAANAAESPQVTPNASFSCPHDGHAAPGVVCTHLSNGTLVLLTGGGGVQTEYWESSGGAITAKSDTYTMGRTLGLRLRR